MSKEIYISSTPHETRLAIVENDALTEMYYERENEYTLAGSIYNGKVTRVLPGMQSSFVDIGLERDAFLYITDFMEEAGDAADFEANANSGDAGRAPKQDRGQDRGRGDRPDRSDRQDRGDRGGRGNREPQQAALPAAEPSDSDLFLDAVGSLDAGRPAANERGERNDRGRRNRRGSGDRQQGGGDQPKQERQDRPEQVETAPAAVIVPHPDATEEVGEGAPGADGSRRWRGRRGRRGGKNREENGGQKTPPVQAPVPPRAQTGPVENAYGAPDFEGMEETVDEAPMQEAAPVREERGNRDRGNRDRGDRGSRTPRGFAPAVDLHQVEDAGEATAYGSEAFAEAPATPIILPGESLSKYRPGGDSSSKPAEAAVPATPVAEFVVQGWDGGSVLPGETLRPRPNAGGPAGEARQGGQRDGRREGGASDRGGSDRGGRDRGGRDRGRSDRGDRFEGRPRPAQSTPVTQPVVESEALEVRMTPGVYVTSEAPAAEVEHISAAAEPEATHEAAAAAEPSEPTYLSDPDLKPASHLVTPINSTFIAPPPMPVAVEEPAPKLVAPEFEPEEASASYRIDPAPPQEFRQPAPVLEQASFAEPDELLEETELAPEPHAVAEPNVSDPADLHTVSAELQHAFENHSEFSEPAVCPISR